MKENRFVGKFNERLWASERERAQTRAVAANQNKCFESLKNEEKEEKEKKHM